MRGENCQNCSVLQCDYSGGGGGDSCYPEEVWKRHVRSQICWVSKLLYRAISIQKTVWITSPFPSNNGLKLTRWMEKTWIKLVADLSPAFPWISLQYAEFSSKSYDATTDSIKRYSYQLILTVGTVFNAFVVLSVVFTKLLAWRFCLILHIWAQECN